MVRPRKEWNLLDQTVLAALISHDDDLEILDEIIALRCQLEGMMASRAADRLDDAQRNTLSDLLAQLEKATDDPDQHTDLDVTFHEVIMNASAAPLGQAIIATLNTAAYGSSPYIGRPTSADRKAADTGHRKILEALLSRDGEAARQAMSDHIHQGWLRRRPTASRSPRLSVSRISESVIAVTRSLLPFWIIKVFHPNGSLLPRSGQRPALGQTAGRNKRPVAKGCAGEDD